jgi:2-oxoglutarate/2-oxoacid ferredoxin oxidoreductase subunit beta
MASLQVKDYLSELKPVWCPGCGDFGVLNALGLASAHLGLRPENLAVVSGIGCSSRIPGYIHGYGFHSIHGRALPVATGLKLARPGLTVIVTMGDGDAYSIGGNHFLHAARRNLDLTCIIMDNRVYGMTKGQMSPTTPLGDVTGTTPYGSIDPPLHPLVLALASGATFAARGFSWDPKHLAAIMIRGIRHRGFSVIDVISPCVVFRPEDRTGLRDQLIRTEEEPETRDRFGAMKRAAAEEGRHLGVFYEENRPTYWDDWEAKAQSANSRPLGVRGLDSIVAALPAAARKETA